MNWRVSHRYLLQPASDFLANNRWKADRRILMVRDAGDRPDFYSGLLKYLARDFPEVRAYFELKLLRSRIRDWSHYVLCVPLVQDPVKERSLPLYEKAKALEASCRMHNIPVINPVDSLSHSIKSVAAELISATGVRTAKIRRLTNADEVQEAATDLGYPFFIRENEQHGGPMLLIRTPEEMSAVKLEQFVHPIAVEYIDTRDEDGFFRKYRYLAVGERGIPHHKMCSRHWEVRDKHDVVKQSKSEEPGYCAVPDPNHEALQAARKSLGVDFCAFDYAYDRGGGLVVCDANPYPCINVGRLRSFAAQALFYLERAGLPAPEKLKEKIKGL